MRKINKKQWKSAGIVMGSEAFISQQRKADDEPADPEIVKNLLSIKREERPKYKCCDMNK